ncbi:MAG: hypothetical protein BEN19_04605 [Epulopiscium sp. Nuni2H_MBin003]|nr:MAG: hypothetical protein BEN19_04605 [Epulopiscium sp. Nuni2H_MBin003]
MYRQIEFKRILVASGIAASLYCLATIVPFLQTLPYNIYYIILPCIPIIYLFKPTTLKNFFKMFFISWLCASIIGGFALNIYYQTIFLIDAEISLIITILSGAFIAFITYYFLEVIRRKVVLLNCEAQLAFKISNNEIILDGIIDTGNTLYTVLKKEPVIVVSTEEVEDMLNNHVKNIISCIRNNEDLSKIVQMSNHSVCLIPFDSIGCTNGLIVGIKVQDIQIKRADKTFIHSSGVIGLSDKTIFKNNNISALIHPDFIN